MNGRIFVKRDIMFFARPHKVIGKDLMPLRIELTFLKALHNFFIAQLLISMMLFAFLSYSQKLSGMGWSFPHCLRPSPFGADLYCKERTGLVKTELEGKLRIK